MHPETIAWHYFGSNSFRVHSLPLAHVFISYVRENQGIINRLCKELRSHRVDYWIDREHINPGQRWQDAIRCAIEDGTFFIACFSEESLHRETTYMNEELTLAIEQLRLLPVNRTWFIPARLSNCMIPPRNIGGGETLRHIQWVDLYGDNWRDGIRRIIQIVHPTAHVLGATAKGTILFVDNDKSFLAVREELLWNENYRVLTATDPIEASRILAEESVDLVILEIRLIDQTNRRDLSGLVVAEIEAYRHLPKIILTSLPDYNVVREALQPNQQGLIPAVDFVLKQEAPEALLRAVEVAFNKYVHLNG